MKRLDALNVHLILSESIQTEWVELEKQDFISTMVKKEEEAFHKTLLNGEKLLKSFPDEKIETEYST